MIQINHNGKLYYPPEVGDTIYRINPGWAGTNYQPFVESMEVDEISCMEVRGKVEWGLRAGGSRWKFSRHGKSWWADRASAVRALEKMQKKEGME